MIDLHQWVTKLEQQVPTIAFVVAATLLLLPSELSAQVTRQVPSQYASIQQAIDAAQDGDTVLVSPGVYFENIRFFSKQISLESVNGALQTTIDGSLLTQGPNAGSVISAIDGESISTQLIGFSIVGGVGTQTGSRYGGAIYLDGSSLNIRECLIFDNSATFGGGIAQLNASEAVILTQCTLFENVAAARGGAIYVDQGHIELNDVNLDMNSSLISGGGVELVGVVGIFESTLIANGLILNGHQSLFGAGLAATNSSVQISNGYFANNVAGQNGGGLLLVNCVATLLSCSFEENAALSGGAITLNGRTASIARAVFWKNTASIRGGAIDVIGTGLPLSEVNLKQVTMVANIAPAQSGAAISLVDADCIALESIFWGQLGGFSFTTNSIMDVRYSVVEPSVLGVGNFYLDPLFVDEAAGEFHLQAGSPCIDSGDPTSLPDWDGTVSDLGAFGFEGQQFVRGDVNNDLQFDISDVISILSALFQPGVAPIECEDAADINDDGATNIADTILGLAVLFSTSAPQLSSPAGSCGLDPTADTLLCTGAQICP